MRYEFSMILAETNRSKAYLQNLIESRFIPVHIILLIDNNLILPEQRKIKQSTIKFETLEIEFDTDESLIKTINKHNLSYEVVNSLDVNSRELGEAVRRVSTKDIIFSGPGGGILRSEMLSLGKRFIHVHPGILPDYKGSTTIYYSYLIENQIGCSVIELNEKIDSGKIFLKKRYEVDHNDYDFDVVIDPLIRTDALLEYVKKSMDGTVAEIEEGENMGDTFYIIHPILKHLSILKQKNIPFKGGFDESII